MAYAVSKAEFERLLEQALADLPAEFAEFLDEVPIEIHDRPSAKQLRDVGLGPRDVLLGLYHGRPRTQRSVEDSGRFPDVIYIFQEHVQRVSNNADDLVHEVRTTVLHEIGHHFGMTEEDLDDAGYG